MGSRDIHPYVFPSIPEIINCLFSIIDLFFCYLLFCDSGLHQTGPTYQIVRRRGFLFLKDQHRKDTSATKENGGKGSSFGERNDQHKKYSHSDAVESRREPREIDWNVVTKIMEVANPEKSVSIPLS